MTDAASGGPFDQERAARLRAHAVDLEWQPVTTGSPGVFEECLPARPVQPITYPIEVFDTLTGQSLGMAELPHDVLCAAALVAGWMKAQSGYVQLYGLQLTERWSASV